VIYPGGFFISLEGPEGAGKSTQGKLLVAELTRRGYEVLALREPGGTGLGEELRRVVKHHDGPVCSEAELLIFSASRVQLMREVILPHLEKGGVVVCDRFADSTTAYQGYGRGLDLDMIRSLHEVAVCGRWPDLTLLLDLPVRDGFERTRKRAEGSDRMEDAGLEFHNKVRSGYLALAVAEPWRVRAVRADGSPDEVSVRILGEVDVFLGR
jgi:dTMP kinase